MQCRTLHTTSPSLPTTSEYMALAMTSGLGSLYPKQEMETRDGWQRSAFQPLLLKKELRDEADDQLKTHLENKALGFKADMEQISLFPTFSVHFSAGT